MPSVRRALISVSDKRGLAELATGLHRLGWQIVSTGGTARALAEAGLPVVKVSEATGFPEILGGRVKTLHPKIHGGILAQRGKDADTVDLARHGIAPIDLVAVNLYPFRETVARPQVSEAEAVESIDVGGPCMIRAAAKSFAAVTVVVDPDDYAEVLAALESGEVPAARRRALALKAFRHTAEYDAAISAWMEGPWTEGAPAADGAAAEAGPAPGGDRFPERLALAYERVLVPRYGENPHQAAAVYRTAGGPGVFGGFAQLQGKELSFNNLLDADGARRLAALFAEPAVAIVKHGNPSGVGRGADLAEAYRRALATDPVSAFGSVVAVNRAVDAGLAERMADLFIEVLAAPEFTPEALAVFAAKKNLRLLACPVYPAGDEGPAAGWELRSIDGGLLVQERDDEPEDEAAWSCPTRRQPTADERRALSFAWRVARRVGSNAIVVAGGDQTVGVGAGQMSRVDSCRLAIEKAQLPIAGTVAASDAFFPFRDGVDQLAEAGVTAIVQPGGSVRDAEVVAACDERGVAMLLTGRRHFRH